jgi:mannose-6-phosphate isomerase-like protein (cupin superfamily)
MRTQLPDGGSLSCTAWANQAMWWSERYRNRALLWPAGEAWFVNDPLGPKPHSHPGASEIYFLVTGRMEVEVGRQTVHLEAGATDFLFIPPSTFHDPRAVGDGHVCLLGLVAPNFRDCRAKYEGFTEEDMRGAPVLASTGAVGALPGDDQLVSAVLELAPGEQTGAEQRTGADRFLYVLRGQATLTLEHLSGALEPHRYVNVMAGVAHTVANRGDGPLHYLSVWAPSR